MANVKTRPVNTSRTFNKVKKHINEQKTGINFSTGQPLTHSEKAWRGGYDQGAKDMYHDVKAAVDLGPKDRVPEGKRIEAGLFDVK